MLWCIESAPNISVNRTLTPLRGARAGYLGRWALFRFL